MAMMRQLCVRNFSSSISMTLGIFMASSYDLGIRGSLIIMIQSRLMNSQCFFSKIRKLNSAWSFWPRLIFVLSFEARSYQYKMLPSMSNLLLMSLSLYLSGSSDRYGSVPMSGMMSMSSSWCTTGSGLGRATGAGGMSRTGSFWMAGATMSWRRRASALSSSVTSSREGCC